MSSTGSGYDYSCGTFSPDGRIFQVEYAQKAVENSSTAVGIKCTDGVVIAVGKAQASKMLVAGSNRQIFSVDSHCGIGVTGYAADGRIVVSRAREEASNYRNTYGKLIEPCTLNNRLSLFMHYCTLYGSVRPFGCTALVAAYDEDLQTPELYMIDPSGTGFRFFGCAAGRGQNSAKTELEKLLNKQGNEGITSRQAIIELANILHTIRDSSKEKPLEIEMSWLCEESQFKHVHVPKDLLAAADAQARAKVEGSASASTSAAAEEKMEI